MNSDDLKEALRILGWSGSRLARTVGAHQNTVSAWMTGKSPVPHVVGKHLRLIQRIRELSGDVS